jgi:glycine/D-amino acid oxidase-like deaminating enzyme
MSTGSAGTPLDGLVIGGGQAGLAMGYHLAQSGMHFQIADAGAEIGHVWRSRWDSLRLFTSGRYDNLPGLPFPAAPDAYPGKDDVADYLQAYAAKFELPVRPSTNVTSITRGNGTYLAKAGGEVLEARQVVVATGPFQVPFIPPIADGAGPRRVPGPQCRLPAPADGSAGKRPGDRRRELRLPDRPGTVSDPPGRARPASGSPPSRNGRWAATSGYGRPPCGWTR